MRRSLRKYGPFLSLTLSLVLAVACGRRTVSESLLPIARKALADSTSVFYGDFGEYPADLSSLAVGLFDCSTDGFEVVEKILTADHFDNITGKPVPDGIADFGGEHIQMLFDKANGPYGGYLEHGNPDFLREQLVRNTIFLTGTRYYNLAVDEYQSGYKDPVKLVLVSSPVAALYGMNDINSMLEQSGTGVKAVGVIEAGIRKALDGADEEGNLSLGVLYAPGGVSSREYETVIRDMAADRGLAGMIQVFNQEGIGIEESMNGDPAYIDTSATVSREGYAGPVSGISYNNIDATLLDRYGFSTKGNSLLFPAGGRNMSGLQLNSVENYVRYHLVSMIERHRRSGSSIPISAIILTDCGFNHVRDIMEKVMRELYDYKRGGIYLYHTSISPDFRFIDPAECAVSEAYSILRNDGNLALRGEKSQLSTFISLPSSSSPESSLGPDGYFRDEYMYARSSGTENITTKVVPLAPRYIDDREFKCIEDCHETFLLIRNSLY